MTKKQIKENTEQEQIMEIEATHQAAMQIVQADIIQNEIHEAEIKAQSTEERERLIAEASRLTGRIEGLNATSKFVTVTTLMILKQIKENKIYKDMQGIGTWENYCKSIGFSREKIDKDLENLAAFGEDFLVTVTTFGIGYRQLRQLKTATKAGALEIKEDAVVIEGEIIPLNDTDYLKDALADLIINQQKNIKEKDDELKAKTKALHTYATEKEAALKAWKTEEKRSAEYKEKLNTIYHGRLGDIPAEDRDDFQTIRNLEVDFDTLHGAALLLADKPLSPFNGKMLCSVIAKMMVAIDDIRIDLNALHPYAFDGGILDRMEKALMEKVETPADFLKD